MRRIPLTLALLALAGCGASMPSMTAGVTTGGAQDIGFARNQLAAGRLPSPESFVVEGLLKEHDIDVPALPCAQAFCLDTAVGVAHALDTQREEAFLVLGFSSGIDLATFRRRPLNLAVVVDRSGSMSGGKIAAARTALHKLLHQLGPQDRLSLVLFDDRVDVVLPATDLTHGTESLHALVDEIVERGSTDIESGLLEGYRQIATGRGEGRDDRVLLLTDAQPNTGRTDKGSFIELARAHADQGIGLTVFGVGLDFGQDLTLAISKTPGASFFYLETDDRLATVFDRDFDLLVTPVAWDVDLHVEPAPGYRIVAAYGVPDRVDDAPRGAVDIHIPTLFLSRNRGAIVLRMAPEGATLDPVVGTASLAYRERRSEARHESRETVRLAAPAMDVPDGVRTAVALCNTALGLKHASRLAREGQPRLAEALLDDVDRVIASGPFDEERRLVAGLRRLVAGVTERPASEGPRVEDGRWIR